MPDATTHPSPQELSDFGLGRLPAAVAATVADHLQTCPACWQVLAERPPDSFVGNAQPGSITVSGSRAAARAEAANPPEGLPPELAGYPKYRFVRELGRGGMGVVYQAEQTVMGRRVAVKVINPSVLAHPDALPRFRAEVRAAAKLDHPNIVCAYDAEQVGGLHLLVMEFVEGTNLADLVQRKGPLPVAHACHFIRQAALGLQHAFEQGMVHRDIKPQNLMVTPKGQVKVLDFGLARLRSGGRGLTEIGSFMGTPEYVSPEQAADARTADIRADLYSLGCTLYFLLTGRPPFVEDAPVKVILAQIEKEAPPVRALRPEVPAELSAVVARLLAKDPAKRYQQPVELAQALVPFIKAGARPSVADVSATPSQPSVSATGTLSGADTSKLRGLGKSAAEGPANAAPPAPLAAPVAPPPEREESGRATGKWLLAGWYRRRPVPAAVAGVLVLLGLASLWAGGVFKLTTPHGTIVVEDVPEDAEVRVEGQTVTLARHGDEVTVTAVAQGPHRLKVVQGGQEIWSSDVTVKLGGAPVRLRMPPEAAVTLEIEPPGAELFLDEQKVTIAASGDKKPVEIKARAGVHKLRVSKAGFAGFTRDIDFRTEKAELIRVRLESVRRAFKNRTGDWKIERGELITADIPVWRQRQQALMPDCRLVFGDFAWMDYDFSCEARIMNGTGGVGLLYRVTGAGYGDFFLGDDGNKNDRARSTERGRVVQLAGRAGGLKEGRWYKLRVQLRGKRCQCFLDGQPVFDYEDAKTTRGAVGFWTWTTFARFRSIRVTDPAGQVLFEGLPELPANADQWPPATDNASDSELHCLKGHGAPVTGVAFSRDGRQLLSCSDATTHYVGGETRQRFWFFAPASTARLWDGETGRALACSPIHDVLWFNHGFTKLALAPNSSDFLLFKPIGGPAQAQAPKVELWKIAAGKLQSQILFPENIPALMDLAFTPDGRKARALGANGSLWEWDVADKKLVRQRPGDSEGGPCAVLAPDGRHALLARRNRPFAEIDLDNGKDTGRWKERTPGIQALAFSSDGRHVLSGGTDGTVRLWDVAAGEQRHRFAGHRGPVRTVAFSPDGRRALSGGADQTVRLWDLEGKQELACFIGHTDSVRAVAFAPDGSRAASGSEDYTVRLWRLPPAKAAAVPAR